MLSCWPSTTGFSVKLPQAQWGEKRPQVITLPGTLHQTHDDAPRFSHAFPQPQEGPLATRVAPCSPTHLLLSLQQTDTCSLKHWPGLPGVGTAAWWEGKVSTGSFAGSVSDPPSFASLQFLGKLFLLSGPHPLPGPIHGPSGPSPPFPGPLPPLHRLVLDAPFFSPGFRAPTIPLAGHSPSPLPGPAFIPSPILPPHLGLSPCTGGEARHPIPVLTSPKRRPVCPSSLTDVVVGLSRQKLEAKGEGCETLNLL